MQDRKRCSVYFHMRIAYIAAGAGDMYCGACARDATLARGLLARGHEVRLIPLYTPIKVERDDLPVSAVYFGGINVYLQQALSVFRWVPRVVDRVLDRPAFLRWVAKYAIAVDAKKLGPMTVSMLAGTHGRQRKEVERLMGYLEGVFRPEVVNLTNSLISGIAPEVRRRLKVPVVCTYQGEESFVNDLPEPHRSEAYRLIHENMRSVDRVICPSEAIVPEVAKFLGVSVEKLSVIHTAVEAVEAVDPSAVEPFTIGYLSVVRPGKGLDLMVEAMRILVRERGRTVRLLIAGRVMVQRYWRELQEKIRRESLGDCVEFLGEVDGEGKAEFMRRCSVFCVPSRFTEPRGVAVLEAMAAGVPVIVPDTGVFPELVALGGGG
ncbi:MAG: glycosyltransferase family 4 protein, partial [Phycisphaerales bacterium]|nr:glycosyltransferase family 4 protein [Phycisphaerales bacterium]